MIRINYKPSKFATVGEKFDISSGLGGSFTVSFIGKTESGDFIFRRAKTSSFPAATYTFAPGAVTKEIYRLIPDKYERLMLTEEAQAKYETMLNDPHVAGTERH